MKSFNIFLIVIALVVASCIDLDATKSYTTDKAKIVFYTNAQAVLNCGPFDVNVYVDSVFIGSISEVFTVSGDELPDCKQSRSTLFIEKDSGMIEYYALTGCEGYGEWKGKIDVKPDSCYLIFLDITKLKKNIEKGQVLFYTNAQAILNCGEFDVNIFVDNIPVGMLSKPYLPLNTIPITDKTNESLGILTIQENTGLHNYYAECDCSNYGIWKGEFEIQKDSCIRIFLDVNNSQPLK